MKETYWIEGMTCMGCKASVEKTLNAHLNIVTAQVNLEQKEAKLEIKKPFSDVELSQLLPDKYRILKQHINPTTVKTIVPSTLKQLFPLLLIFTYILGASFLMHFKAFSWQAFMLDFMGLFFIVFSFFKLLDLKGFPSSFKMYDPLAKRIPTYGWLYPFIELALGLFFLMRINIPVALILTLLILGITTVGVTKALLNKKQIPCACLGTVLKLPMTKATFIENSIMIVMAVIMLVWGVG